MRGCLLGPKNKTQNELWLIKEGKRVFDRFFYVPIPSVVIDGNKVLYKGKDISKLDFIIPRIPRTYVWFGYTVLNMLKDRLYLPIEPESVLISHNKFLTLLALKEADLPVPDTFLATSRETLDSLLGDMYYPVVMKLLYGSLGKGVMFADSKQSARSLMDTLERFEEPIFLEEFVPNPGEDIRAFVLGGEVLGGMRRLSEKDELRANIAIGGRGEPIKLNMKYQETAVSAAKVLGMDICGIDMLRSSRGPVIIEANVNVHFEGLTKYTKTNVAKAIVNFVKREVEMKDFSRVERVMEWLKER